jgi:bifunctional DNA-binding transcriptional regulator/antitoxin component of YhaV-PrlF toxin-antitoxin module
MAITFDKLESMHMDSKRIRVSQKRQVTIPQKYFERLNIGHEVECILRNGEIVIRPVRDNSEEFAEEILRELVNKGFTGDELIEQFKKMRAQVRPAVEKLIEEADKLAINSNGSEDKMNELFGDLED